MADLAFTGRALQEAKVGILAAAAASSLLSWTVYRLTGLLPPAARNRALLGSALPLPDLAGSIEPAHDHVPGPEDAAVTVVEYGDYECPYCGDADPVTRDLLLSRPDVRYVGRHLPLSDVHPHARLAAEAAEAAGAQGAFWPMHTLLLQRQDRLEMSDLLGHAADLGPGVRRFHEDLRRRVHADRVERDITSADRSGVSGTHLLLQRPAPPRAPTVSTHSRGPLMLRARAPSAPPPGRSPAWPCAATSPDRPVASRARAAQVAGSRHPTASCP
ncbi:thioredoxin domain-containing protein [Streptomyces sp. NPDC001514]